jgi:deazaflavin-dependent oxidoreductase (nitroreductase family)
MLVLPRHHPNFGQRVVKRLAALPAVSRVLARLLRPVDNLVLRLSGERHTATSLLTGLPVVVLTCTGARSGQPRRVPLLTWIDGPCAVLFGTNFGGQHHPAWVYNLRAHPLAWLEYRGRPARYRAREASPAEADRYWEAVQGFYPGYASYRQRARHRQIAVFVLEPASADGND